MKKSLGKKTMLLTHPVMIIGSYDKNGTPNIMAVSWGGICCSEPPCVAISLRKSRYSYQSILDSNAFTVNMPPVKYLEQSDYSGIYSGKDENKFETLGLTPLKSQFVNAPEVAEFPLTLHCKLLHTFDLGIHTQFIGENIETSCDIDFLDDKGIPDIIKINPFIYDTSSRHYYSIGRQLKKAYTTTK